jgi:hypothetical protein
MRNRSLLIRSLTLPSLLSGLLLLIGSSTAAALDVNPAGSFLTPPSDGCLDAVCASPVFSLDGPTSVSGSMTLSGNTLSFSIDLASASFSGSDGPVTGVTFSNVNYSGSLAVTTLGSFIVLDSSAGSQTATVSGTVTPSGAGSAVNFTLSGVQVSNLNFTLTGGGPSFFGGLRFGPDGFDLDVNGNTRFFQHTLNVSVIPEPGTAVLLIGGLAGLAAQRRRPSA